MLTATPSIFNSAEYQISESIFRRSWMRELNENKSSSLKTLSRDNIGFLCATDGK